MGMFHWAEKPASTLAAGGVIGREDGSNEPDGLLFETAFLPIFAEVPGFIAEISYCNFGSDDGEGEQGAAGIAALAVINPIIDMTPLLDNIAWHTLTGPHARFAAGTGGARRYAPGFSPIVGFGLAAGAANGTAGVMLSYARKF